ncbi:MAG TPA: M56 family metallopeptidase [Vicinamibacteria bacterium]|nr:M56 family metallopeptidase [Vicinamibacteria bacterium]
MSAIGPHDVQTLGLALLHFVWQGALLGLLLAMLNLVLRHAAPQVRYLLAASTLLAMLLAPFATFALVQPSVASALRADPGITTESSLADPFAAIPMPRAAGGSLSWADLRPRVEARLPWLVGLWGAGVLLLSLRTLGGWALVQRLKSTGLVAPPAESTAALARLRELLRVSAPVRLYESALVGVPTVIGWLRPVILVPASALSGLTPQQLELILAHELAHVSRRDYLVNLLQTMVETLLFYHPAVFWVSRRMRIEREHCCDDLAVAACGNPVRYARALADLQGMCADAPALAMAATGGSLLERVARLVSPPSHASRASRGLAALLVVGSLALALGVGSSLMGVPPSSVSAAALVPPGEPAPLGAGGAGIGQAAPKPDGPAKPEAVAQGKPEPAREPEKPRPQAKAEPRAFPLDRILELAQAGVTPEYIDEMEGLGYKSLSAERILALRNQGVSVDYVKALGEAGYRNLTPEQLLSLRAQGVSAEYAREMKKQGMDGLSLSDLLSLRAQGVTSDYVAEMKGAGYDDLSVSKLLALRAQGVSGEYAAELKTLGYEGLSVNKLMALRAQGVTVDYARGLKAMGYKDIPLPMLLALRAQGVTVDWVKGLQDAGYPGLPLGALLEMRAAGVTVEFVQEMKEAGFVKLEPHELIELRNSGVRGDLVKRLRGRQ